MRSSASPPQRFAMTSFSRRAVLVSAISVISIMPSESGAQVR